MYVVQEVVHVPSTFAIRIYAFPIAAVGRSRARSRILIEVKSCSWIHEIPLPVRTGCASSSSSSCSAPIVVVEYSGVGGSQAGPCLELVCRLV